MRITLIALALCLCAVRNTTRSPLNNGIIGKQLSITHDVTETTQDPDMKEQCPFIRITEVEYELDTNQGGVSSIFYRFTYCLDKDKQVVDQAVAFRTPQQDQFVPLPEGCLPPKPEVNPPPENECTMSYKIGTQVSQTIANMIVPKFIATDGTSPIEDTDTYKKYQQLLEEHQKQINETTDLADFQQRQDAIVEEMQQLINDFADEKIKCFEEHVIPQKETTMEIVCTSSGAHKTIGEALKAALGQTVNCGSVSCESLAQNLADNEHAMLSFLGDSKTGFTINENFQVKEGEPDASGNVRIPSPDKKYFIVHSTLSSRAQISAADGLVGAHAMCPSAGQDSLPMQFTFRRHRDSFYTIQNQNGQFLKVNTNGELVSVAEMDHLREDLFLFRLVQNLGGSVTLNSVHYTDKVIGMRTQGNKTLVELLSFNQGSINERFFLREECRDKYVNEVDDNGQYSVYDMGSVDDRLVATNSKSN